MVASDSIVSLNGPLSFVNSDFPLSKLHSFPQENGPVVGMCISSSTTSGSLLATFNFSGIVKIYNLQDYSLVCTLQDFEEEEIEEHFVGTFLANDTLLAVGGKLKRRRQWSEEDDDNAILPCPIKIFEIATGKVVGRMEGHKEEILSIRTVLFDNTNYLLSTSQDGYIIRWKMTVDWYYLKSKDSMLRFADDQSCMVFKTALLSLQFPGETEQETNLFVLAACDEGIRLFDFKNGKLIKYFDEPVYSSYVDDICLLSSGNSTQIENGLQPCEWNESYLLTRGVELIQSEEVPQPIHPNTITLHKLTYQEEGEESSKGGEWQLTTLFKYSHPCYLSNSWYIKFATTSRYVFAPTSDGKIFIFSLCAGQLCGVLSEHEAVEIRQVLAHPTQPLLFSCSDDGNINVYGYSN